MRRKEEKDKLVQLKQRTSGRPLAPITLEQCLPLVRACSKEFAETCGVDAKYISHSWWVRGVAQILGNSGYSVMTDVRDHAFRNHLGNFLCAVKADFPPGIDVLACPNWSRYPLGGEDYGKDERYLPAFHAVRIFRGRMACSNKKEGWSDFFELHNSIGGPLTITVVGIDVFEGAEGYRQAADQFGYEMKRLGASYEVSTKQMNPGIFASITIFEPTEPFQILVASKIIESEAIKNPKYEGPRRPGRLSR
jgi:hypothetical protein